MEANFLLGVGLGGVVGFVASLVANLSTPLVSDWFASSKAGWLERNKKRSFRRYEFVKCFVAGTEDKYMYYLAEWGQVLMLIVLATSMGTIAVQARFMEKTVQSRVGLVFCVVVLAYSGWKLFQVGLWRWAGKQLQ